MRREDIRFVFGLVTLVVVMMTASLVVVVISGSTTYPAVPRPVETLASEFELKLMENINATKIKENLRHFTSFAHMAGTKGDKDIVDWVAQKLKEYGWETSLVEYNVLLSYPNTTHPPVVKVISPAGSEFVAALDEPTVVGDADASLPHAQLFNAYAATGTCESELVYAGYGRHQDYDLLEANGVSLQGKVGIVRYGHGFRGNKAVIAEQRGLCGLVLYSDPNDYGSGTQYPDGPWLPPTGAQRGTTFLGYGDPLTPYYASVPGTPRLSPSDPASQLIRIPVQPVSAASAYGLMKGLGGISAKSLDLGADWVGGLDLDYKIGSGPSVVHLSVNANMTRTPIWNVVAKMEGSEEPDRAVILGNHHDAWVFGATDPNSGSSAMLEIGRAFGVMAADGWRPRRTILLCSWDAEEFGLLGSTEWVEDNLNVLNVQAVAYLNVDIAVEGTTQFRCKDTPSLTQLVYDATKVVPHPTEPSLYNAWVINETIGSDGEPVVSGLGSGSDFLAFVSHAGVSSVDFWFQGIMPNKSDYPVYHSIYDSYHWMATFGDPTFKYHQSLARLWAVVAVRLADQRVLPLEYVRYAARLSEMVAGFEDRLSTVRPEAIASLQQLKDAIASFASAAATNKDKLATLSAAVPNPIRERMANDVLMATERSFLAPEGLPGRTWLKHQIYAPSQFDTYASAGFPGIVDAIWAKDWELLDHEIWLAAYTVTRSARVLSGSL